MAEEGEIWYCPKEDCNQAIVLSEEGAKDCTKDRSQIHPPHPTEICSKCGGHPLIRSLQKSQEEIVIDID